MAYPKQKIVCKLCEGYKRVAIINGGPRMFDRVLRKPLPMTYAKARKMLLDYRGDDAGFLTALVHNLADRLSTTPCPWCKASGISHTMQQLSPEES